MARRVSALFCWTLTVEQVAFGAGVAAVVAVAPLGQVAGPWRLLTPRRLAATFVLLLLSARRIVVANLRLSRLIWDPRLPLRSGMIVVPTRERSAGGLTAVGLITSVIVDNQLVDVARSQGQLQYHAVEVPEGGPSKPGKRSMGRWNSSWPHFTGRSNPMSQVYLGVAIGEMAIAVLLVVWLAAGPTISDRIVALNTISTQAALAVLYFAAFAGRTIYLDVALWLTSFSYLGAIIWSRYLERGLL